MENVSFEDAGCFTPFFLDYINQDEKVEPLVGDFFSKENFKNIELEFSHRDVLVNSLKNQYKSVDITPPDNIEHLLDDRTYTVTTGHQLSLFTGPLYFHYKIMSTIKLADSLSTEKRKVVPIFWMATEDHDFEEINHFHFKEETFQWNSMQKGAVGEFSLDDMDDFLKSLPEEFEWMKSFYQESTSLVDATRKIVHHLYGKKGLVILDANRPELKRLFLPIIKEELQLQTSFNEVLNTNKHLHEQNYKVQVNPREINLFYKSPGIRERILKTEIGYEVNNTDLSWTTNEFYDLIEKTPEVISPNVILRPVYQQTILPNLAYVGGPGELIYWLQLKSTHEVFGVHFPILVPRDHLLFLEKPDLRKINKLGLCSEDLFSDLAELNKTLILDSSHNVDVSMRKESVFSVLDKLQKDISEVDVTLNDFMEAEKKRFEKNFLRIKKKINKAISRKEHDKLSSLNVLMSRVQPNGTLQERRSNFLNYHLLNPSVLDDIYDEIDPFDVSFKLISSD